MAPLLGPIPKIEVSITYRVLFPVYSIIALRAFWILVTLGINPYPAIRRLAFDKPFLYN